MARSDRVSLTYTADIGDIRRKLKQIPDLTAAEVRQATSALNKATRQTQRAAQRGRRDSQAFSTSLAAVGAAATGAVVGLGMMAQSLDPERRRPRNHRRAEGRRRRLGRQLLEDRGHPRATAEDDVGRPGRLEAAG
jgi:hypothetical protein